MGEDLMTTTMNLYPQLFGSNSSFAEFPSFYTFSSYPRWQLTLFGLLTSVVVIITIVGNLIVILSFVVVPSLRQPTNYFIASLAVSDLMIGVISMPFFTIYLLFGEKWPLGEVLCDLWLSIDYTLCMCSIYTVFCITVDRFCSVKIPTKYRKWRTNNNIACVVFATWFIPITVFFSSIFGWQHFSKNRTVPHDKCYVQYIEEPYFNCILQIGYFWITLSAMIGLYVGIYRVALDLHKRSAEKRKNMTSLVSMAGKTVSQIGTVLSVGCRPGDQPSQVNYFELPINFSSSLSHCRASNSKTIAKFTTVPEGMLTVGANLVNGENMAENDGNKQKISASAGVKRKVSFENLTELSERRYLQQSISHYCIQEHDNYIFANRNRMAEVKSDSENTVPLSLQLNSEDWIAKTNDLTEKNLNIISTESFIKSNNESDNQFIISHQRLDNEPKRNISEQSSGSDTVMSRELAEFFFNFIKTTTEPTLNLLAPIKQKISSACSGFSLQTLLNFAQSKSETNYFIDNMFNEFGKKRSDFLSGKSIPTSSNFNQKTTIVPMQKNEYVVNDYHNEISNRKCDKLIKPANDKILTKTETNLVIENVYVQDQMRETLSRNHNGEFYSSSTNTTRNDGICASNTISEFATTCFGPFPRAATTHSVHVLSRPFNADIVYKSSISSKFYDAIKSRSSSKIEKNITSEKKVSKKYILNEYDDDSEASADYTSPSNLLSTFAPPLNLPGLYTSVVPDQSDQIKFHNYDFKPGNPQFIFGKNKSMINDKKDVILNVTGSGSPNGQICTNSHQSQIIANSVVQQQALQKQREVFQESKFKNRTRKALKTITIILGAFVTCWIPWHVLSMIKGFYPEIVPDTLYNVSYWLCYLNSPINPFCYAFVNQQFKQAFFKIMKFDCKIV